MKHIGFSDLRQYVRKKIDYGKNLDISNNVFKACSAHFSFS